MMYHATVTVRLRPTILDPEGKAIEHALSALDLRALSSVRVGKQIDLTVDAGDEASARALVDDACRRLLSNPVMEEYTFTLTGGHA